MEKITDTVTAHAAKFVRVTPNQLRALANRLETHGREAALPGEMIVVSLTPTITLIYDPEVRLSQLKGPPIEFRAIEKEEILQ